MEPANAGEFKLLQVKVEAAKVRLKQAQLDLTSVLNLLTDLPAALKTGVMRAIETAFDDLGQAETHVLDMETIVRANASHLEVTTPSARCPHCLKPYGDATSGLET